MSESVPTKRALKILGDPNAKEDEWMLALQALGGKVPSRAGKRALRRTLRFFKRVSGLTLMYFSLFFITGLFSNALHGSMFGYVGEMACAFFTLSAIGAVLEAGTGLFTVFALWALLTSLPDFITIDPLQHTCWMVPLLNFYVYKRFRWRPYVFVPINAAIREMRKIPLAITMR